MKKGNKKPAGRQMTSEEYFRNEVERLRLNNQPFRSQAAGDSEAVRLALASYTAIEGEEEQALVHMMGNELLGTLSLFGVGEADEYEFVDSEGSLLISVEHGLPMVWVQQEGCWVVMSHGQLVRCYVAIQAQQF